MWADDIGTTRVQCPYNRRFNGTSHKLNEEFVHKFLPHISEMIDAEGLRLEFQTGLIGGACANSDKNGRNLFQSMVIFYVFYQLVLD